MKSITKLLKNFDVSPQIINLRINTFKLKKTKVDKNTLIPISYSYNRFKYEGSYFLFVKELTPEKFHYYVNVKKPILILTNQKIDEFFSNIPVFFTKNLPPLKKLNIEVKEKQLKEKQKVVHFTFGYGNNFINVFIYSKEYRNLQIFKTLLKLLRTINYPRGYRVRFIFLENDRKSFIEYLYKDYFSNAKLNILIDKTGFGLERLIYKTNGYFHLNRIMIDIINKYMDFSYDVENDFETLHIPNLLWFKSIKKNHYINTSQKVAKNIFSCMNFLAKEMI